MYEIEFTTGHAIDLNIVISYMSVSVLVSCFGQYLFCLAVLCYIL